MKNPEKIRERNLENKKKLESKQLFIDRAESRMSKLKIKKTDLFRKMDEKIKPDISYKSKVSNLWFRIDHPTTKQIPDEEELRIIAEILDCDIEYLTNPKQTAPKQIVYDITQYTGLSEKAIDNLNTLNNTDKEIIDSLNYLLEYHSEDFELLLYELYTASKHKSANNICQKAWKQRKNMKIEDLQYFNENMDKTEIRTMYGINRSSALSQKIINNPNMKYFENL